MRFSVRHTLSAPSTAVFAVISDPRLRPRWQSSLRDVQLFTEGPPRLGTRWRETTTIGARFELEITCFESPTRWAERAQGRLADAWLVVHFIPLGPERTQLRVDVEVRLKGAARLLGPLVRGLMPGALRRDLDRCLPLTRQRLSEPSTPTG